MSKQTGGGWRWWLHDDGHALVASQWIVFLCRLPAWPEIRRSERKIPTLNDL